MDQLKYHVVFNFSKINFTEIADSTLRFSTRNPDQPSVQLDRIIYMTLDSKKASIPAELEVSFRNKSSGGSPFNLGSMDFTVVSSDAEP
jgi:hypothetical protein